MKAFFGASQHWFYLYCREAVIKQENGHSGRVKTYFGLATLLLKQGAVMAQERPVILGVSRNPQVLLTILVFSVGRSNCIPGDRPISGASRHLPAFLLY